MNKDNVDQLVSALLARLFDDADVDTVSKMLDKMHDTFVNQSNGHALIAVGFVMAWLMEQAPEGDAGIVPILLTTLAVRHYEESITPEGALH